MKAWIDDKQLIHTLSPDDVPYTTPKQLMNLWIKYGNECITGFFNDVKAATTSNPSLASFLLSHYLVYLPNWDYFYNNHVFFSSSRTR